MPLLHSPAKLPNVVSRHQETSTPPVPDDLRPAVERLLRDMAFILRAAQAVRMSIIEGKVAH